jgi:hypothetical protein
LDEKVECGVIFAIWDEYEVKSGDRIIEDPDVETSPKSKISMNCWLMVGHNTIVLIIREVLIHDTATGDVITVYILHFFELSWFPSRIPTTIVC